MGRDQETCCLTCGAQFRWLEGFFNLEVRYACGSLWVRDADEAPWGMIEECVRPKVAQETDKETP